MTNKNQNLFQMKKTSIVALILLIISSGFYLLIRITGDFRSNILHFILIIFPIFLVYFYFIIHVLRNSKSKLPGLFWILIFGIFFRLIFISQNPVLSDDIYRYLWDGKVSAAGINPYQFAPNATELELLHDSEIYPNINCTKWST